MSKTEIEVPRDANGRYIYNPEQVATYHAVLAYEVRRQGGDPNDAKQASVMTLMAGGVHGKSALLYRIASGLAPLVIPAPRAMSYPWYAVVEDDGPWEITMEGDNIQQQIEIGKKTAKWAKTKGPIVLIEQSIWKLVRKLSATSAEVTVPGWEERGYLWRLSIDVIPAKESQKAILAHHNPSLRKITTLVDLEKEQHWHVDKFIRQLEIANDDALSAAEIEKAKAQDATARGGFPGGSRFNEYSTTQRIEIQKKLIQDRVSSGKPAIPDATERESMFQEHMARYLAPKDLSGFGWYSVAASGELLAHGWRLHRILPTEPPGDLYLDIASLAPAPNGFLSS